MTTNVQWLVSRDDFRRYLYAQAFGNMITAAYTGAVTATYGEVAEEAWAAAEAAVQVYLENSAINPTPPS